MHEWDNTVVSKLSSVSHVAVSSAGHVAFRFAINNILAVYDRK